jgi:hypothetical protein
MNDLKQIGKFLEECEFNYFQNDKEGFQQFKSELRDILKAGMGDAWRDGQKNGEAFSNTYDTENLNLCFKDYWNQLELFKD